MKKKKIEIIQKGSALILNSSPEIMIQAICFKENFLNVINRVLNGIFSEINKMDERESKSEMVIIYLTAYNIESEYEPFSIITNTKPFKNLLKIERNISPSRLVIEPEPKTSFETGLYRITLSKEEKENLLEIIIIDLLKDEVPIDLFKKGFIDSGKIFPKISKALVGERIA